jgi:hypothetical protein
MSASRASALQTRRPPLDSRKSAPVSHPASNNNCNRIKTRATYRKSESLDAIVPEGGHCARLALLAHRVAEVRLCFCNSSECCRERLRGFEYVVFCAAIASREVPIEGREWCSRRLSGLSGFLPQRGRPFAVERHVTRKKGNPTLRQGKCSLSFQNSYFALLPCY